MFWAKVVTYVTANREYIPG